jgi:hypothetical protein
MASNVSLGRCFLGLRIDLLSSRPLRTNTALVARREHAGLLKGKLPLLLWERA